MHDDPLQVHIFSGIGNAGDVTPQILLRSAFSFNKGLGDLQGVGVLQQFVLSKQETACATFKMSPYKRLRSESSTPDAKSIQSGHFPLDETAVMIADDLDPHASAKSNGGTGKPTLW